MGKNKKHGILNSVLITDIADEGLAVGRHNNMVVFVKNAVPGDVVDVQVRRAKSSFYEGVAVHVVKASEYRDTPFCKHFGVCGGCKWQHLRYAVQLQFKQQQIINQLTRIGGLELPEAEPIMASDNDRYYRNKLEYTFSDRRWFEPHEPMLEAGDPLANGVGFHIPGLFDKIVDIKECFLQDDTGNRIRNFIRTYALHNKLSFYNIRMQQGYLRNLILRNNLNGEFMLVLCVAEDRDDDTRLLLECIQKEFPEVTSLHYALNTTKNDSLHHTEVTHFSGATVLYEQLGELRFAISPKSFFQTNTVQANRMYNKILEFSGAKSGDTIYDLYTGTGTIALFLAASCKKVIGIEYIEEAIRDARTNAGLNKIENTHFVAGDMKDVLNNSFIDTWGKPDIIVTDPPRAGMHPGVVETILKLDASRIVYVSCNAATQARDMQMLHHRYKIEKIQAIDMFPHTHHVENIALLIRRTTG